MLYQSQRTKNFIRNISTNWELSRDSLFYHIKSIIEEEWYLDYSTNSIESTLRHIWLIMSDKSLFQGNYGQRSNLKYLAIYIRKEQYSVP